MVSICQGFLGAEYFLTNLGCLEIIIIGVRAWVTRPTYYKNPDSGLRLQGSGGLGEFDFRLVCIPH